MGCRLSSYANKVLTNKAPLAVDDGNISNSDYNSAVSLYNYIAGKMGAPECYLYHCSANQNTTTTSSATTNNQVENANQTQQD